MLGLNERGARLASSRINQLWPLANKTNAKHRPEREEEGEEEEEEEEKEEEEASGGQVLEMLYARDLLLTIAAAWLLVASLESRTKRGAVLQASAAEAEPAALAAAPSTRAPVQQLRRLDGLMSRLRKNLAAESGRRPNASSAAPQANSSSELPNSYSFFANQIQLPQAQLADEAREQQPQRDQHFKGAKEVKIEFLRSAPALRGGGQSAPKSEAPKQLVAHNGKRFRNGNLAKYQRPEANGSAQSLYLLSYQQQQILPQMLAASASESPRPIIRPAEQLGELLSGAEQQQQQQPQQPPFVLFPQLLQQQQNAQQGFSAPQAPILQDPRIRQILSNYQRLGAAQNGANLGDYQRQLLTQLSPRPQQLHLRPPTASPAAPGQQTAGGQGPLSPLQLLAGPLQAFLPGLQQPQAQPQSPQQPPPATGFGRPAATPTSEGKQAAGGGAGQPVAGGPAQFSLLNPFGTRNAPATGGGGLANLQELYQQTPLYQTLLAMRQRQEALQAAQRARAQPQPQPLPAGQPGAPPSPSVAPALLLPPPPPGAQPPLFAGQLPGQLWGQHQQQAPLGGGQSPFQPQQPALPVLPPPPPQQTDTNEPANQPVQFDDEQPRPAPNPAAPSGDERPSQQHNEQNSAGGQANEAEPEQNNDQENNSNADQQQQQQQDNNNGSGEQGGGQPEAEDADLKQFQNFANGGDSFTDLFPPGILSNNDINEIKSEQDKQNKKQEAEERQKQQQQQQSQSQSGQQQPAQQPPPQQVENSNGNNNEGSQSNDDNEDQGGQEQPQEGGEGGGGGGEGEEGGSGGGEGEEPGEAVVEQAKAAALTGAKADGAAASQVQRTRQTSSPGVEYAARH